MFKAIWHVKSEHGFNPGQADRSLALFEWFFFLSFRFALFDVRNLDFSLPPSIIPLPWNGQRESKLLELMLSEIMCRTQLTAWDPAGRACLGLAVCPVFLRLPIRLWKAFMEERAKTEGMGMHRINLGQKCVHTAAKESQAYKGGWRFGDSRFRQQGQMPGS